MFAREIERAEFQKVMLTQYRNLSVSVHVSRMFSELFSVGNCYWGVSNGVLGDSVIPLECCRDEKQTSTLLAHTRFCCFVLQMAVGQGQETRGLVGDSYSQGPTRGMVPLPHYCQGDQHLTCPRQASLLQPCTFHMTPW